MGACGGGGQAPEQEQSATLYVDTAAPLSAALEVPRPLVALRFEPSGEALVVIGIGLDSISRAVHTLPNGERIVAYLRPDGLPESATFGDLTVLITDWTDSTCTMTLLDQGVVRRIWSAVPVNPLYRAKLQARLTGQAKPQIAGKAWPDWADDGMNLIAIAGSALGLIEVALMGPLAPATAVALADLALVNLVLCVWDLPGTTLPCTAISATQCLLGSPLSCGQVVAEVIRDAMDTPETQPVWPHKSREFIDGGDFDATLSTSFRGGALSGAIGSSQQWSFSVGDGGGASGAASLPHIGGNGALDATASIGGGRTLKIDVLGDFKQGGNFNGLDFTATVSPRALVRSNLLQGGATANARLHVMVTHSSSLSDEDPETPNYGNYRSTAAGVENDYLDPPVFFRKEIVTPFVLNAALLADGASHLTFAGPAKLFVGNTYLWGIVADPETRAKFHTDYQAWIELDGGVGPRVRIATVEPLRRGGGVVVDVVESVDPDNQGSDGLGSVQSGQLGPGWLVFRDPTGADILDRTAISQPGTFTAYYFVRDDDGSMGVGTATYSIGPDTPGLIGDASSFILR